jgi:hypothetical protein
VFRGTDPRIGYCVDMNTGERVLAVARRGVRTLQVGGRFLDASQPGLLHCPEGKVVTFAHGVGTRIWGKMEPGVEI